jgi:5-methyltetrahydrofolate--homocysteine methyltransferase
MSVEDIFQSILQFKHDEITDLVQAEINAGTDVSVILEEGLIDAMGEVGSQFSSGYLFVPEMLEAARTMKTGLHDIGKDLVGMMLEGAGFEVFDLGVDVAPKAFMDAAVENQAQLVATSALLTTSMPVMGECIGRFKDAGIGARIIVGGAPINRDYAIKINADGYGSDAPGAVELANSLVPKQGS